jgi:hypothetical protein
VASDGECAALEMQVEFSLAGKDALASYTLEVIAREVLFQLGFARTIKITSCLQAMLVLYAGR